MFADAESSATPTGTSSQKQHGKQRIEYVRPTLSRNELKSVLETLVQEDVSFGQGVLRFEKAFARTFDFEYAIAVDSYTSAFHLALMALEFAPGAELVAPVSSPLALLDAAHYVNASIVPVDLARDAFHPDPEAIVSALSAKTRAVYLPYTFGAYTDFSAVYQHLETNGLRSAKNTQVFVIEDLSHAIGHDWSSTQVGRNADITIVGLNEEHLMTIGKGAVLLTDSPRLNAALRDLRVEGGNRPYRVRFDYAITDYQAALGLEQLSNLSALVERRRRIGTLYREAVAASRLRTFFKAPEFDVYGAFPVLAESTLDHLQRYFASLQIETRRVFAQGPLHHLMGLAATSFPNAERLYQRGLLLPIYPMLNKAAVDKITNAIRSFY
ncbi:MAG: DegT/DnrJ/EryC1/StrS aminotransferase family protein [Turneriella sp.]|nr:DegT/DnrJ/EryC1/StrS aminotransferase family protein [Turneriella sp.]